MQHQIETLVERVAEAVAQRDRARESALAGWEMAVRLGELLVEAGAPTFGPASLDLIRGRLERERQQP